jgi:hypothetical protein
MRGRRVALVLVAAIVATGALAAVDGVRAARPAVAAQSPDDFRNATTIDLLTRGPRPRDRLRLASGAGSTSIGTMRQDVVTKQTVSGLDQPTTPLTVTADVRTTVVSVDRDGVRTISFAYANASLPELNGVGGSYDVTDRGFTSNEKLEFLPGTDAETQDTLQHLVIQLSTLSTPYPFEAVGVGARWKVTEHPVANGLTSTRSVVYTLVERTDNRIVLRSKLRQTAPSQPLDDRGLPADATATLVASESAGAGDLDLDLNQVLPNASTVLSRVDQVIEVEQGTQGIQIAQTVMTNVSISSTRSGA